MSERITIFHTNDLHGALTPEKAGLIARLMAAEDALLFDSGDCIKAGNIAIPLKQEPAWELLAQAGCDAGTLGNRETHPLEKGFKAKLAGAKHPLICANLKTKAGASPLPGTLVIQKAGLKIGLIGVMVPMVTARMAARAASQFLWDPPLPAAQALASELRPKVDLLIALTHIGLSADRALASACPDFDIILGGHSHSILKEPEIVGKTAICQGGAFARFVGRYVWEKGRGIAESGLIPL